MTVAIITGASSGMGRDFVYAIDKEFELYSNKACLISNHPSSTIYVDDGPLNGYYIYLKEGKLIYNYPYILLNGHLYHGESLKNHDYLEIANIKIIYNQDFLSIASDYAIKLKPYAIKFKAVVTEIDPIYENEYTATYTTMTESARQMLLYYMYIYSRNSD